MTEEDPAMLRAIEAFTLKGIRILLAEDNDINAEIAMEILAMEGAVLTKEPVMVKKLYRCLKKASRTLSM